jgi:hypothetical protein
MIPTVISGIFVPIQPHSVASTKGLGARDRGSLYTHKGRVHLVDAQSDQLRSGPSPLAQYPPSRYQGIVLLKQTTNVLLCEGNIAKISDFNVSTTLDKLGYTRTGTLTYASP